LKEKGGETHFSPALIFMKTFFVCFMMLWLLINNVSYAVLTQDDVRQIIKEENAQLEIRLKEYVDMKTAMINVTIVEMDKRVAAQINALDNKITTVQWALGILIVVIVAILALPQAVSFIRERKETKEITELKGRIDKLEQKLEEALTVLNAIKGSGGNG
jgi:di/tricarboxylate transporter